MIDTTTEADWTAYREALATVGYARNPDTGNWMVRPLGSTVHERAAFDLTDGRWTITEHNDGTITVTPSIWIGPGQPDEWHGWLTAGVWSSA